MKIALALLAAAPLAFGFNKKTTSTKVFRRLGDENANQDEDEVEFLQNYEQVYVTCDPNEVVYNEAGEAEYGAVVYRLCPKGTGCSDKGEVCSSANGGDYVVGLQTYMERFLQQFEQEQDEYNNNQENEFNFGEFGDCKQYEVEADEDGNNNQDNQVAYYLGPMCTSGGDIKIALFATDGQVDEAAACQPQYESVDVTFEDLTGISLPWSSNILEDEICKSYYCYGQDADGNYEYNEFCTGLYEQSSSKCEENLEYYSPYGQNVQGCEMIAAMLPKSSGGGGGAGWFIFAILIAAVAGFGIWYFLQQKKKTAVNQEGLMM